MHDRTLRIWECEASNRHGALSKLKIVEEDGTTSKDGDVRPISIFFDSGYHSLASLRALKGLIDRVLADTEPVAVPVEALSDDTKGDGLSL